MKINTVRLENWKNFVRAEAVLQRRNFLVGPNASGKSNFLDSLRFMHEVARDGVSSAIGRRGGLDYLRSLGAPRNQPVVIDCELQDSKKVHWRYRLGLSQNKNHGPVTSEQVKKEGRILVERPTDMDRSDPDQLGQTHLEQSAMNQAFRPVAEAFKSIQYFHIVPQFLRQPHRVAKESDDPYGTDFLEHIWRTDAKSRDRWLARIEKAVQVSVPQIRELKLIVDHRGLPHLQVVHHHESGLGAPQTEEQLSDGTLRFIGLVWSLLEGKGPLLLEEPELSLHPEIIRYLPRMAAQLQKKNKRQLLISTHSLEMLYDKGIAADEMLLLKPGKTGTEIEIGVNRREIKQLMEEGLSAAEAAVPEVRVPNVRQLSQEEFWK
jgi:predicted ATPase